MKGEEKQGEQEIKACSEEVNKLQTRVGREKAEEQRGESGESE